MTSFLYSTQLKLNTKHAFEYVLKKGKRWEVNQSRLYVIENECSHPRLGLIIAKRTIAKAVRRNSARRVLREHFRLSQHALPNIDIVIIAGRPLGNIDKQKLQAEVSKIWQFVGKHYQKQHQPSSS
jgi:ribonuclease P protein component